jgi:glycosyltransferase involved in cell wall biosynthesis
MIEKVDLVMWTKNGSETLPSVLERIGEVIPDKVVNKRVIVDDRSSDNTLDIARSFGWNTFQNEGEGIGDGANTALKQVESDYFISFEQDLLLAEDWWQRIPKHLSDPSVAVASGVRLPNQPEVVRKIQEYTLERYERRASEAEAFLYGKTLDNTIYKTKVIRSIGGFPKTTVNAGVDNILAQQVHVNKFEWKVDYSVRSTHLRKGLREELAHYYWYGTCFSTLNPLLFRRNVNMKPMIIRVFLSPLRGLEIAVKKSAPQAVYVYPLMRFAMLKGIADGLRVNKPS